MSCKEYAAYARLAQPVVAATETELVLGDGKRVLDLYGGHCVNTLGAGDAGILRAVQEQWRASSFVTNLVDHPSRAAFLEAFGANLPPQEPDGSSGWQVFLSNSGAEANENALKAALAVTGRDVVVCFAGGFHGRTSAACAVSDMKLAAFPRTPFEVRRVPFGDVDAARAAIDESVAAVILEPIQSLAGIVAATPAFLTAVGAACDARGAKLIFDEVQTGNGRLGVPWASQHYLLLPDAFTTAKGAAGGLPIGITVLADELAEALPGGLFGSTFGGGPTVLAAAREVALRIQAPGFLARVREVSAALRRAASTSPVERVRGAGLLLGLELEEGVAARDVRDALLAEGVLVGLSNDPRVLRLTPPLTLGLAEVERFAAAFAAVAQRMKVGVAT